MLGNTPRRLCILLAFFVVVGLGIRPSTKFATGFQQVNEAAVDSEPSDDPPQDNRVRELEAQVAQLSTRVAMLERIMLTQIIEAEPEDTDYLLSAIEVAEERLEQTERLFDKGYVAEAEVSRERFNVERAKLRLDLAQMSADAAEAAGSLQMLEAQASLDLALQRLAHSERLAARGYVTRSQLRADELDVERARSRVDAIKQRLRHGTDSEDDTDEEGETENLNR